jgi:hypothetical protein
VANASSGKSFEDPACGWKESPGTGGSCEVVHTDKRSSTEIFVWCSQSLAELSIKIHPLFRGHQLDPRVGIVNQFYEALHGDRRGSAC